MRLRLTGSITSAFTPVSPRGGFAAADEMGLYLEIECSSWANQSTTLGDGRNLDRFIWEESERIVREFGNHPSFCMMMYGNEPGGKRSNLFLTDFVKRWKERDARRLYCSGAGWPNLPVNDFLSDSAPRIQAWGQGLNSLINAQAPRTDYDWSGLYRPFQTAGGEPRNRPVVCISQLQGDVQIRWSDAAPQF